MRQDLTSTVALVTGASRGTGRRIAVELGARGATVYAAGRTSRERRSPMGRPETVEDTADLVTAHGGRGVPARCDFTDATQVDALARRITDEQEGRLDVLIDDMWGGDPFVRHGEPFWTDDLHTQLDVVRNGLESHLTALHRLLPLMVARSSGLVVEITDGDSDDYHETALPYYLVKCGVRRIAIALAAQLHPHGITAAAVTPGFLRSEAMLEHFGTTEKTWRDVLLSPSEVASGAVVPDAEGAVTPQERRDFGVSESPRYTGRGIAALAADPGRARWSGSVTSSAALAREYDRTDVDGSRPDIWGYLAALFDDGPDPDPADYR